MQKGDNKVIFMNRLKDKYINEVLPKLQEELKLKNKMAIPGVKKVVLSIGLGEAKEDKGILDKVNLYLGNLAGQRPVVTYAKKSIAGVKLSQGAPVGVMVSLRGSRMYIFLDKFFNIVLPKVRDFRGISSNSFDGKGNFTLGIREQLIFPEVDYKTIDKVRGMAITIVTTAKNKEEGKKLLEFMGMPFKKGEVNG